MSLAPKLQVQKLPIKRLLLISSLVATVYALVLLWVGNQKSPPWEALISWNGLLIFLLCLLNYLLRGWRWRMWMACFGRFLPWAQALRFYVAGYTFTPTPGNVGEALRGLLLARHPLNTTQSVAIFGAERLADLLCLMLLCLPAGSWLVSHFGFRLVPSIHTVVVYIAVLLSIGLVLGLGCLTLWKYRHTLTRRMPWLDDTALCLRTQPAIWLILTLLAWTVQGLALWLLCRELQVHLAPATAIGFYALAMVAGAFSALPAGLGSTEAVLSSLLIAQGSTASTALSITVVVRLLTLWLAVALGGIALLYGTTVRKEIHLF